MCLHLKDHPEVVVQHLDAGSLVLKQQFGKASNALADSWIDVALVGAGRGRGGGEWNHQTWNIAISAAVDAVQG